MYVGKHVALILWLGLTVILAIVAIVVMVITRMVRNKVTGRPGSLSWPAIVVVAVCLVGVLFLLLR